VKNESGVLPVEYKCIVKLDPIAETTGSGLIFKPDIAKEKERWQTIKATLVAAGGLAFTNPDWGYPTPKVGDRIYVAVAAGIVHKYNDMDFRIVRDQDIAGILSEE
jgi:co-chaperonin GroES (HSP10)